jgi:hypothetical protein
MEKLEIFKKLENKINYKAIIEEGKEFKDPDFPAEIQALGDAYNFPFKSAKDLYRGEEKVYVTFEADDILQGCNKDSYFLSALSALSEFPSRVETLFLVRKANPSGCYAVTLYISGYPFTIVVDHQFPYDEKKRKLAFANTNQKELWVMLLEKAWAKVHGNYTNIDEGDPRESLAAITGAPVEMLEHPSISDPMELWKIISGWDRERYVMCTGGVKGDAQGLEANHTYTLINTYEVKFKDQEVRLVQIRNPWGSGEWKGAWSDADVAHWTPELNKELNHTNKDDGTFFMQFEDFAKIFEFTSVAKCRDDYIHSHTLIEENSGFAVVQVHKTLKGFASAHQMTERCSKRFVGNGKVQPLHFEIYNFTGANIMPLKISATSNDLGVALIPLTLEPGFYIFEAKFTGEPSVVPFVCFAVYADQAVDIVSLKAKKIVDISMDMCLKGLKTVQPEYYIDKPTGKMFCNFSKCPKGHLLVWSTQPREGPYKCESCRNPCEVMDGRWRCDQCEGECEYDICPKCRPHDLVKVTMDEAKKKMTIICNLQHQMTFSPNKENMYISLCEKCGHAIVGKASMWRCEKCNLNICQNCLQAPPNINAEVFDEISKCPRKHKLLFEVGMVAGGGYNCAFCNQIGNPLNGRWYCIDCNFNICPVCIPNASLPETTMAAGGSTTTCTKGHTLAFTSEHSFEIKSIVCDKCKKDIPLESWRWNCFQCPYDICKSCRPEPEGRKDLLCNRKHMLSYSKLSIGKVNFTRCDRCHEAFIVTDGRLCCGICSFNLCQKCEPCDEFDSTLKDKKKSRECHVFEGCWII